MSREGGREGGRKYEKSASCIDVPTHSGRFNSYIHALSFLPLPLFPLALLPALECRRRQDAGEEDGKEDGKEGGVVVLGSSSSISSSSSSSRMKKGAAGSGLTDIRTNTKEDLTMLIR